jgi:hypothetical protein
MNLSEVPKSSSIPGGLNQIRSAPALKVFKPSRFNAHTTNAEGQLILYNSYSGHVCSFPPKAVGRIAQYLSQAATVREPLDKIGQYLLSKGYIVDSDVDEDARFDVRYGAYQHRTDVLQLIFWPLKIVTSGASIALKSSNAVRCCRA